MHASMITCSKIAIRHILAAIGFAVGFQFSSGNQAVSAPATVSLKTVRKAAARIKPLQLARGTRDAPRCRPLTKAPRRDPLSKSVDPPGVTRTRNVGRQRVANGSPHARRQSPRPTTVFLGANFRRGVGDNRGKSRLENKYLAFTGLHNRIKATKNCRDLCCCVGVVKRHGRLCSIIGCLFVCAKSRQRSRKVPREMTQ
jgi:hypothetical protein